MAIAMIARVVEEVAPNKNQGSKTTMRKTFGTLIKDPTMSRIKLLRGRSLLNGHKGVDMGTVMRSLKRDS